jgi:anti-sigma factor RsiW
MSTSHPAELQLLDYVEGCLAGEELRGLRRHVATCSACQETLRELSHAVDALERLPTADIPHDGMREQIGRNRRRLWMRALPILALVLVAGAVVQELRPSAIESSSKPAAAAASGEHPSFLSSWVVAHVPSTASDRDGIKARLAGFAPFIPPDHGSLVALVDLDDLPAAEAQLEQSKGSRTVTVLLIGVQGLGTGQLHEEIRPTTTAS